MRLVEAQIRAITRSILKESQQPTIDIDRKMPAFDQLIRSAVREAREILRGDIEEMERRLSETTVLDVGSERYELENEVFDGSFDSMWETLNNSPSPSSRAAMKMLDILAKNLVSLAGPHSIIGDVADEHDAETMLHYLNESIVQEIVPPMPLAVGWRTFREDKADQEKLAAQFPFEYLRGIIRSWIQGEVDDITEDISRATRTNDPDLMASAREKAASLAGRINSIRMTAPSDSVLNGGSVARGILRDIGWRSRRDSGKQAVKMVEQGLA